MATLFIISRGAPQTLFDDVPTLRIFDITAGAGGGHAYKSLQHLELVESVRPYLLVFLLYFDPNGDNIFTMVPKILVMLTSHGKLGDTGKPTGWFLVSSSLRHISMSLTSPPPPFSSQNHI